MEILTAPSPSLSPSLPTRTSSRMNGRWRSGGRSHARPLVGPIARWRARERGRESGGGRIVPKMNFCFGHEYPCPLDLCCTQPQGGRKIGSPHSPQKILRPSSNPSWAGPSYIFWRKSSWIGSPCIMHGQRLARWRVRSPASRWRGCSCSWPERKCL